LDKRYQVFISSTFNDLKEERQAVLRAVLMLDHMPAGMELFPATDDTAWQLIRDVIDASDYYLLILGGRYGSLDEEGIGFTEKEYRYATSQKIPVVPFLHSNPDNLPRGKTETSPGAWRKLTQFRQEVESNHTCMYWDSAPELQAQVILGLTATLKRNPRPGWVRANALASAEANRQIIELQNRLAEQKEQLERLVLSPPAGTERLAAGDEKIAVEFKVTLTIASGRWDHPNRSIRDVFKTTVTWDQLFGAIAPNLTEPQRDLKVRNDVARFLREHCEKEIRKKHPKYLPTSSSITEGLFQTIRLQFMALGLIECRVESVKSERGTEKDVRYCELTPYGRSQLLKIRAILSSGEAEVTEA
jgi:hypothetical protein